MASLTRGLMATKHFFFSETLFAHLFGFLSRRSGEAWKGEGAGAPPVPALS